MKFLITGAAGFIGSNLSELLLQLGHEVVAFDNFDPYYDRNIKESNLEVSKSFSNFHFFEGDLLDTGFLNKIFSENQFETVIHLAAKGGVRHSLIDPVSYYDTNVNGTIKVLEVMRKFGVNKMVFASSSSVYGDIGELPVKESYIGLPISPYGASKKAGENICNTYHHLYGINIFCLRFFTVYGPRQRPEMAISLFSNKLINEEEIELYGNGNSFRDYTFITDALDGILKSVERINGFEILNIGGGKTTILNDLLAELETIYNKKATIKLSAKQAGDVEGTFADISRAKTVLGYQPKYDIRSGLKEYCNWIKEQKASKQLK